MTINRQVSPFRNLRIDGYVLLPAAYRSLSRLSSALSAKASTLRPYQLNLCAGCPTPCGPLLPMYSVTSFLFSDSVAFFSSKKKCCKCIFQYILELARTACVLSAVLQIFRSIWMSESICMQFSRYQCKKIPQHDLYHATLTFPACQYDLFLLS